LLFGGFVFCSHLRPTLDEGPWSNFLGTNLDSFEASWILGLDCTLVLIAWFLVLQIRSSPFSTFFGLNQLIFPPKPVPCRFSLNLPLFGLGPLSKGLGTDWKLLTNMIAWIHLSLDLGPSSKVALNIAASLLTELRTLKVHWVRTRKELQFYFILGLNQKEMTQPYQTLPKKNHFWDNLFVLIRVLITFIIKNFRGI
jgi:hypothetical protein